jgi:hypothetical protein
VPRIIIERERKFRLVSLAVEICFDKKRCGLLKPGSRMELIVDPGAHSIALRIGRKIGRELLFASGDRETVMFRCKETGFWARNAVLQHVSKRHSFDRFSVSARL